jgi:hypothetical protein
MKQYLLAVYHADGEPPPDLDLERMARELEAINAEMKAAGVWVFAGGLHPSSTATVVRSQRGDPLITDGPYLEGKEHLGGFTIVNAPDLDAALRWANRLSEATTLPVEVRPFQS